MNNPQSRNFHEACEHNRILGMLATLTCEKAPIKLDRLQLRCSSQDLLSSLSNPREIDLKNIQKVLAFMKVSLTATLESLSKDYAGCEAISETIGLVADLAVELHRTDIKLINGELNKSNEDVFFGPAKSSLEALIEHLGNCGF